MRGQTALCCPNCSNLQAPIQRLLGEGVAKQHSWAAKSWRGTLSLSVIGYPACSRRLPYDAQAQQGSNGDSLSNSRCYELLSLTPSKGRRKTVNPLIGVMIALHTWNQVTRYGCNRILGNEHPFYKFIPKVGSQEPMLCQAVLGRPA